MRIVDAVRRAAGVAVLALLGLSPSVAWAASGTALGVDPQAEAETSGIIRVLTVGADLNIGDVVRTGAEGQVQIKFSDQTELVVGPNSVLTIEDYLLRGDNSAGKLAINALAGTFRFATGVASKDRYLITTPTGTIGVRGTEFDFNVDEEGTQVLLFHGAVRLCNTDDVCVTLDDACEIGEYDTTDSQIIGPAGETTGEERAAWKELFQYAEDQSTLNREFWFEKARECFNAGFVNDVEESLVEDETDEEACEILGFLLPEQFDYTREQQLQLLLALLPDYGEGEGEYPYPDDCYETF